MIDEAGSHGIGRRGAESGKMGGAGPGGARGRKREGGEPSVPAPWSRRCVRVSNTKQLTLETLVFILPVSRHPLKPVPKNMIC